VKIMGKVVRRVFKIILVYRGPSNTYPFTKIDCVKLSMQARYVGHSHEPEFLNFQGAQESISGLLKRLKFGL
jgi:hypothetical protein